MSHSLLQARDERGEVVAVDILGGGMVEISARLPHLAATARPGQFAQLRCGGGVTPLLRRPFSVAWTEGDVAAFVLAPVGTGTRILASLQPGDQFTALGPLGNGFTVRTGAARSLCVSGGLGCAPFPLLIRALRRHGQDVTVVSGAARAALLYPPDRFARGDLGVVVVEFTVDGSRGAEGLVTAGIPADLDPATAVYACGPNPMLAAVSKTLLERPASPRVAEVSLEAPMGCGFGTCLGCALPVHGRGDGSEWALCCTDGPVMPIRAVAWEELMRLPPAHVA
ncbi:MAG: dihydroorotate dehydrogenase electron transfer subunit [Candidatus Dormibacteraeota bacterium]|nr:dihydroorotate dehydrogenase electron transfer subunit [Candidatus Dormibacteraeota bacterium]